ncbi:MAG: hypothetical protein CMH56_05620 [Myxococcales bacterium]|nr:hypothetical protein [Myxococcales bacterium]
MKHWAQLLTTTVLTVLLAGCPAADDEKHRLKKPSPHDDLDLPHVTDGGLSITDAGTGVSDAGLVPQPNLDGGLADAGVLSGECQGNFTVATPTDLAALMHCTVITGNFEVVTNAAEENSLSDVTLPNLQEVRGRLNISFNQYVTQVSFPILAYAQQDLLIEQNFALQSISLPSLETVDHDLRVSRNTLLSDLDLSALTTVNQSLIVQDQPALLTLDFPSLTTVGISLEILQNEALTDISLDGIGQLLGDLSIRNNDYLMHVNADELVGIWGDLHIRWNHSLVSFALPGLGVIEGEFRLESNHSLTSFSMPEINTINGPKIFRANYSLPTCLVDQLLVQVDAMGEDDYDADEVIIVSENRGCRYWETCENEVQTGNCVCTEDPANDWWVATCSDPVGDCLGDFYIANKNNSISLQGCTSIEGTLRVERSRFLDAVDLPGLTSIGEDLKFNDNTSLTHFSFPNLVSVGDTVSVLNNPVLESFNLNSLTSIGDTLLVSTNSALPTCLLEDVLLEQLTVEPDSVFLINNAEDCTCEVADAGVWDVSCPSED